MKQEDTWKPIFVLTQKVVEKLEEQERRKFERDCKEDGVARERRGENADA